MKITFILLVAIIATGFYAHKHGHTCMHDKISERIDQKVQDYVIDENHSRHLQATQPRKFKITYDISYFDNLPKNADMEVFKFSSEKAIKIATIPKAPGAMKWDQKSNKCGPVNITDTDRVTDRDSDLHLYITYTDEPQDTYLAYAGWCRFLRIVGPTHGQVNFNLGTLKSYNFADPLQFQDLVGIVLHEMLHVLGFSSSDVLEWVDEKKRFHISPITTQYYRKYVQKYIRTPHVLAEARKYYGCETIPGGKGSQGSHWETTVINNELMNAAISNTQAIFSRFTTALLRDTGFYYSINEAMEEESFYGKDEGCSFITGACSANRREFCKVGQTTKKCDYYHLGMGECDATTFTDDGCNNQYVTKNARCLDDKNHFQNNQSFKDYKGVSFGHNSRCFDSSLILNKATETLDESGLCYKFECTVAKTVIVYVGSSKGVCTKNGEKISVEGYKGQLQCPEKLDEFCGYKKVYPNGCSGNGYCNNGACTCLDNYGGVACDKKF